MLVPLLEKPLEQIGIAEAGNEFVLADRGGERKRDPRVSARKFRDCPCVYLGDFRISPLH